jgi:pantetheine-phosphate adenylyltransferase
VSGAAIYPGSFDPVTYGHLDIIARAATLFPRLVVAVVGNPSKRPMFSVDERVALLRPQVADLPDPPRGERHRGDGVRRAARRPLCAAGS